jgi:two-component system, chemotaxis family, sensor kinase CheA
MGKSDAQFDRKLAGIFQAEAAGHVQRMQESLAGIGDGAGKPPLEILFRAAHSLKGAARAVGEDAIETACHSLEGVLAALQRDRLAWSAAIADVLHDTVAALDRALRRAASPAALVALVPRLEALLREPAEPKRAALAAPAPAATPAPTAPPIPAPAPAPAPRTEAPAPVADGEQTVRIGVDRLGVLLYQVEELVAAKLQAGRTADRLQEVLASAGLLREHVAATGGEALRAWRQHEALLRSVGTSSLREQRQLGAAVDALLADVKKTLLLPVGTLRPFLLATVRELARSQQKDVELRIGGDEVEMDRRLLEELREPLVHLLRNAVGHGMETPQQRVAAGKPARGLVQLAIAARSGGRVEITLSDDGAGIDTQRLARAARELQLPLPEDGDPADLLPLVFGAGVSTAPQLTQVSGRGIGLAIVRETVERLGGTIAVASTPGQGTTFTLVLTTSLATYRAIEVRAAGRSFLLPTARVERCLRATPGQVRALGGRQALALGGEDLPLASLGALLRLPAPAADQARIPCLLLAAGERRIALAVDEIRGEQEVLGKPVDGGVVTSPVVSGAAVLPSGAAAPILNVSELVRIATGEGGRHAAPQAAVAARSPGRSVLLAEDSITSRTLLKNILELAGHRVVVAVDGAEALARLREASFDVVVSDVEMPRMDGIALTRAIRADAALAHLPVVLVTSLASPQDRERGAEAGANAYIVKSSFDQGNLLGAIAELA